MRSNLQLRVSIVTLPPRNERRLCSEWDGTTSAAMGRRNPRLKLRTHQNYLQMPDTNIPGKTSPKQRGRRHRYAPMSSTPLLSTASYSRCNHRMPVNRVVHVVLYFSSSCGVGIAVLRKVIGVRSTTRKYGVARSRTSDGRN